MLGTKSKFFIDLIPIADQYKVIESISPVASFFASQMHTPHNEISDKIAQNNVNHGIWTDDKNMLNTFNVGDVKKLHGCSSDQFKFWWNWTIIFMLYIFLYILISVLLAILIA